MADEPRNPPANPHLRQIHLEGTTVWIWDSTAWRRLDQATSVTSGSGTGYVPVDVAARPTLPRAAVRVHHDR